MKAILNRDIILQINTGETEIGAIPRGVGLERLRWDGSQIVDLVGMAGFWVEHRGGVFVLHCVPVEGAQFVSMAYADRRRLMNDNGTIRLRTPAEIAVAEAQARVESKNAGLLNGIAGDVDKGLMLDVIKLLYCMIVATREPNAQLGAWLDSQVADMKATFQWADERARMERLIDKLKARMGTYYAD